MNGAKAFVVGSFSVLLFLVSALIGAACVTDPGSIGGVFIFSLGAVVLACWGAHDETDDWGETARVVFLSWAWMSGLTTGFWLGGGL